MGDMVDMAIRKATLADLAAIVTMLADDPLGATRESPGLPLDPNYVFAFESIQLDPAQLLMVATIGDDVVWAACSSRSSRGSHGGAQNAP